MHTGRWRQYADLINKLMPYYSIKTHTSYEEKGIKDNRATSTYRYVMKCESCNREVFRQKKCAVAEHPENYRCKCSGRLNRIILERGIVHMQNKDTLEYIVSCIEQSGNDPRSRIYGYYTTGNECYITRFGDARALIKSVDVAQLKQYISEPNTK